MTVLRLFIAVASVLLPGSAAGAQELVVEIRCERTDLRAGDEIPITFVVTNAGPGTYQYTDRSYDRSGRMLEYQLRAYDELGAPVPDPRTTSLVRQSYIGGGLGSFAELAPGERLSKTIALNLWALVTTAGVYTVRGSYPMPNGGTVESAPLTLRILPRTDEEMGRYIDQLAAQLRRAGDGATRKHLIQRLMYTGDRRAAQPLLELAHDSNAAFWIREAFSYYLPKDTVLLADAAAAIQRQGLSQWSVGVLEQLHAPDETIKELIAESLMNVNDVVRAEAALAAQRYPDDRFMDRLIQLATAGSAGTRSRAIYAIAYNRTDAGVTALRSLLQDSDAAIRTTTEHAIESAYRTAYRMSSFRPGRSLRIDDFPAIAKR